MEFKELCTPAKIYLVLAVISCIIALYHQVDIIAVLIKLIFAFIWTYILSWLCKKGYTNVSWFLVLLPYILVFLAVLEIVRM